MRFISAFACLAVCLILSHSTRAQDAKSNGDKASDLLNKIVNEAKKAASKMEEKGGGSGKELWPRSKEVLALSQDEYVKRVETALRSMAAEILALVEADSAVNSRDYFKTRIAALKQHLDYCRQDLDKLKGADSEETFRVKQKKFDRTLGFLGEAIQAAKEEAGV